MYFLLRLSCIALVLTPCFHLSSVVKGHGAGNAPKVVFISPTVKEHPFWSEVIRCMEAAAEDLSMNFEVVYPKVRNRLSVHESALQTINSASPPDYMVYIYYKNFTSEVLEKAESKGIRSFIFNTGIPPEERKKVGQPMEKFKYWIGHMTVDDEEAGRLLAQALISEARKRHMSDKNGKIHMIGISGGKEASAALDRNKGLASVVERLDDVLLHQVIFAYWKAEKAAYATDGLLERYPQTQLIWSASDAMALAAAKTARKRKGAPEILAGGIDWTANGIEGVRTGKLTATVGGHFMDGAWTLVLIHDHYQSRWGGDKIKNLKSGMSVISSSNIQNYLIQFKDRDWRKIDFKAFSKLYNPEQTEYHFSLQKLLNNSARQPN